MLSKSRSTSPPQRADALIEACAAAGVKLGVFFQDRLRPAVAEIKTHVDDGELGTPVMISGRVKWYRPPEYYSGSKWRGTCALDGGGALMNQAIHTVDLVQWLFGPVARVSAAVATRVHEIEVEDTAAAVLEFASGALGTIEATTSLYPGYPRRIEVTGIEGTVVIEDDIVRSICGRQRGSRRRAGSARPARERRVTGRVRRQRAPARLSRTSSARSGEHRAGHRRARGTAQRRADRDDLRGRAQAPGDRARGPLIGPGPTLAKSRVPHRGCLLAGLALVVGVWYVSFGCPADQPAPSDAPVDSRLSRSGLLAGRRHFRAAGAAMACWHSGWDLQHPRRRPDVRQPLRAPPALAAADRPAIVVTVLRTCRLDRRGADAVAGRLVPRGLRAVCTVWGSSVDRARAR